MNYTDLFKTGNYKFFQIILIFCCMALFYSATFSGTMISGDNQTQFEQTMQILENGKIGFDTQLDHPVFRTADKFKRGRNNLFYLHYVGHPLITLPGSALVYFLTPTSYIHKKGLIMKAWSFHAVLFSAAIICCYWVITRTILSHFSALILTCSLAIASPLWMFSDQCWNNLSVAMCLTVAMTISILSIIKKNNSLISWFIIGIFVGASFIIRPFAVTLVPAFLFLVCYHQNFKIERWKSKPVLIFVISIAVCAAFVIFFNFYRFNLPFHFGYPQIDSGGLFYGDWYEGIKGSVFGPAKSPFYFAPATLLVIPAFFISIFFMQHIAVFAILFFAPYLIIMPKLYAWYGGPDLFQRYWLPLIPVFYLLIAYLLYSTKSKRWRYIIVSAFILLSIIGTYNNFLSAVTDSREVYSIASRNSKVDIENMKYPLVLENIRTNIFNLIIGRTIVADTQRTLLKTNPKTFAILPSVSNPYIRVSIGGIFLLICLCFTLFLEKKEYRGETE